VECLEHGVVQVKVPWAEPRSRFTLMFERLAIDVLSQCDVSGATRILRISWDEAWGLMQRAVKRGRARKKAQLVRRIGVDEKAAAKGHRYLTLVCDLDEGTVEHIAEDRKQESLDGYDAGLTKEQLDGLEAVDTGRKQEHRELMEKGDETLKGSKYLWLYSRENVPERRRNEFAALRRQELKVGRAWAIKEALRGLWFYVYPASGWKFWKRWYFWATHSRLEPIRKAAETVRRHIENILTYY
jgi:transposase